MLFISPIVEGHGEIESIPALLHKMNDHIGRHTELIVNPPIRVKSGSFFNDNEYFLRHVKLAASKAAQKSGIVLILLDCDDGCPADLGPALLSKALSARNDVRYLVVLAKKEFETWLIASISSLRGKFGLPDNLESPRTLEDIRDAKGWIGEKMSRKYDPIIHQCKMTKFLDIEEAMKSISFKRFYIRFQEIASA